MFGDLVVNLVARVNQFTAPMARARSMLGSFQQSTSGMSASVTRSLGSVTTKLTAFAAAFGVTMSAVGAAQWGVNQALQAEKTQIAFEVMLGSAEKAAVLVRQLRDYGRVTGYGEAAQKAAETMIGFGVAHEKVMPSLRALGDIARGDRDRLGSLALAFSQSSAAGRLMGQDLLQMVNAGFNPLQQISAKTGLSLAELKKQMEDGLIPFEMVAQAFIEATSEGGKFNDMMSRIADTVGGQFAILEGNVGLVLKGIAEGFIEGFDVAGLLGETNESLNQLLANADAWKAVFVELGQETRGWFDSITGIVGELYQVQEILEFLGILQKGIELKDKLGLDGNGLLPDPLKKPGAIKTEIDLTPEGMKEWKQEQLDEKRWGIKPWDGRLNQPKPVDETLFAGVERDPLKRDPVDAATESKRNRVNEQWAAQIQKQNERNAKRDAKTNQIPEERLEPFKVSGALVAGSRDAYSAIVNAMLRGGGQNPQQQQLNTQKEIAKETKRQADNLAALRQDIKQNKIGVVEKLD